MKLPPWLASADGRTVTLATCRNCGQITATSPACGFDHLATVMQVRAATKEEP